MKVRLTRKFADVIDGINLSKVRKGDVLDLSARDAGILMAEGWAEPMHDGESYRHRADDGPVRKRSRAQSRKKR